MSQMHTRATRVFAQAMHRAGVLHLYRRCAMKRAAVVLLYHRIVDDQPELPDYAPGGISVRRDAFDKQMAFLRRHYRLTPLADIVGAIAGDGRLADGLCAV